MLRSFRKPSLKPRKRLIRKRVFKYGQIRRIGRHRPVMMHETQKEVETKPNKEKTHPKPSPLDRPLLFRYMQNYDEKDESNEDKESDEDDS